ncbi:MAG: phosphoribosylaminoimidazolesuccinocarboxamide synthase, partial [Candidatus Adiutrix sp.]
MTHAKMLYEGKAKQIFETDDPNCALVYYKDDATAFNGEKKGSIDSKGRLNNNISAMFFEMLGQHDIPTHFIKQIDDRSMLVKKLEIIPIEVVLRNVAAGSLSKRLGWEEGRVLASPIVEFYYKDDSLGDPLINRYHIKALGVAEDSELDHLALMGLKINSILKDYLAKRQIMLIDFKLEFGRFQGQIILGDEISPDTCRFWDATTREKLDKD